MAPDSSQTGLDVELCENPARLLGFPSVFSALITVELKLITNTKAAAAEQRRASPESLDLVLSADSKNRLTQ